MKRPRDFRLYFAVGTAAILALSWAVIAAEHRRTLTEWQARLAGTAQDRAGLVALWLSERRADARVTSYRPSIRRLLDGAPPDAPIFHMLDSIASGYGYDAVLVLDSTHVLAASHRIDPHVGDSIRSLVARMRSGDTAAMDLLRSQAGGWYLAFAATVRSLRGKRGAVVIVASPARQLFPLALRESPPTETGEIYLARVAGNTATLISTWPRASRRAPEPELRLDTAGPERARLLREGAGFEAYTDFAGKRVLASAARVPGTDWVVIRKITREEALAGFDRTEQLVVAAVLFAVIALGLGLRSVLRGLELREIRTTAELVASRDALRMSEERYRALVEGSRDLIFALDPDGTIAWLNPAFEALTGFARREWLGRPFTGIVAEADLAEAQAVFERLLRNDPRDPTAEFHLRTNGGGERLGEFTGQAQLSEGKVIGILGVCRDITDRVTMEEQLRQSSKMEAVGQLAGGIAHDFNNLLTVIIGSAELLLADMPDDNAWRTDVREIRASAGRAATLTRQLLAFSRRQMLAPKVVDLNTIVTGAAGMLRRLIGEHIVLTVKLAPYIGAVRADTSQLEQVIVNLAVNARDAMPGGGTLTITTSDVTNDEPISVNGAMVPPGRWSLLEVRDSGSGMSPEVQNRVFEPFFTTKAQGKGTGLGLASAYGVIKQSGGFIGLESALGQGTMFRIYLPRVAEVSTTGEHPIPARGAAPEGTETILLVEDETVVRAVSSQALVRKGYRVLEAAGGAEALALMAGGNVAVDMLLTDVVMPGMSGPELAARLTQRFPGLTVLFMSGYSEDAAESRGVLGAGAPLLLKPFTPEQLAIRVRDVLDNAE